MTFSYRKLKGWDCFLEGCNEPSLLHDRFGALKPILGAWDCSNQRWNQGAPVQVFLGFFEQIQNEGLQSKQNSFPFRSEAGRSWFFTDGILFIFRTSSWYLHQSILWEDLQQSQTTAGDCWLCCKGMSGDKILQFCFTVLQSMFKGGFSQVGFASFLVSYGLAVCKGWLSLAARPYILIYYS